MSGSTRKMHRGPILIALNTSRDYPPHGGNQAAGRAGPILASPTAIDSRTLAPGQFLTPVTARIPAAAPRRRTRTRPWPARRGRPAAAGSKPVHEHVLVALAAAPPRTGAVGDERGDVTDKPVRGLRENSVMTAQSGPTRPTFSVPPGSRRTPGRRCRSPVPRRAAARWPC